MRWREDRNQIMRKPGRQPLLHESQVRQLRSWVLEGELNHDMVGISEFTERVHNDVAESFERSSGNQELMDDDSFTRRALRQIRAKTYKADWTTIGHNLAKFNLRTLYNFMVAATWMNNISHPTLIWNMDGTNLDEIDAHKMAAIGLKPENSKDHHKREKVEDRPEHHGCKVICAINAAGISAPPMVIPKFTTQSRFAHQCEVEVKLRFGNRYGFVYFSRDKDTEDNSYEWYLREVLIPNIASNRPSHLAVSLYFLTHNGTVDH